MQREVVKLICCVILGYLAERISYRNKRKKNSIFRYFVVLGFITIGAIFVEVVCTIVF